MQTEIDRSRFITRTTDRYTFELDCADLSLHISTSGRQMILNSADIAAMMDLLQQESKDKPVQETFPKIDWSQYVVATFATYKRIALYLLKDECLALQATLSGENDTTPCEAYTVDFCYEEKGEALYFPSPNSDLRHLGIAWGGVTHWATVSDLESGIQQYARSLSINK